MLKQIAFATVIKTDTYEAQFISAKVPEAVQRDKERRARYQEEIQKREAELDAALNEGYRIVDKYEVDTSTHKEIVFILHKMPEPMAKSPEYARLVEMRRDEFYSKTSGKHHPMWRCTCADGKEFNIFQHPDPLRDTSELFFAAGYKLTMTVMRLGETFTWKDSPIPVKLEPDGNFWKPVQVFAGGEIDPPTDQQLAEESDEFDDSNFNSFGFEVTNSFETPPNHLMSNEEYEERMASDPFAGDRGEGFDPDEDAAEVDDSDLSDPDFGPFGEDNAPEPARYLGMDDDEYEAALANQPPVSLTPPYDSDPYNEGNPPASEDNALPDNRIIVEEFDPHTADTPVTGLNDDVPF